MTHQSWIRIKTDKPVDTARLKCGYPTRLSLQEKDYYVFEIYATETQANAFIQRFNKQNPGLLR
jgi:hypothetical protein